METRTHQSGKIIESANAGYLTNFELLQLLKEQRPEKLVEVETQTVAYLSETPAATQTTESIQAYLNAISASCNDLSQADKLQMVNLPPEAELDVHLVIEDAVNRFDEAQIAHIIECAKQLPKGTGKS